MRGIEPEAKRWEANMPLLCYRSKEVVRAQLVKVQRIWSKGPNKSSNPSLVIIRWTNLFWSFIGFIQTLNIKRTNINIAKNAKRLEKEKRRKRWLLDSKNKNFGCSERSFKCHLRHEAANLAPESSTLQIFIWNLSHNNNLVESTFTYWEFLRVSFFNWT